ncbi:MAG: 3-dehydroquinate synthase [Spirochaetota bacterium]
MKFTCRNTTVAFTSCDQALKATDSSLVVTDEHLAPLLPVTPKRLVVLPPGEEHKTWESVERIILAALDYGLGRDSSITAVGGGVVCDLAAFAASVYMRGIAVHLVPTSLLAMVDASLGGKTGADFHGYKNIIGSFHPADTVSICPEMLHSLPEREFKNGLAEVIKHAMLGSPDVLGMVQTRQKLISSRDATTLTDIIYQSLLVKRAYIEEDPEERTGIRAQLNLGHTFAHALETYSKLSLWSHGEAVAWGLARALETGEMLGVTDPGYARNIKGLLRDYGYRIDYCLPSEDVSAFTEIMKKDKKARRGQVQFVLQRRLGETFLEAVDLARISELLSTARK